MSTLQDQKAAERHAAYVAEIKTKLERLLAHANEDWSNDRTHPMGFINYAYELNMKLTTMCDRAFSEGECAA
ncbi:hypothetical protein [Paludisphaera rhizosphaerae]|uniref:hypothetical protein n=1 Tax=Paludisphaera rhizosphaerae TaxID=2711216 RepID=UPI0013EA710D|nr:hypothetical protein [Paludisphaera rhizosphaerae]